MNEAQLQQWADEFASTTEDKALQMWEDLNNKGDHADVIAVAYLIFHKATSTVEIDETFKRNASLIRF